MNIYPLLLTQEAKYSGFFITSFIKTRSLAKSVIFNTLNVICGNSGFPYKLPSCQLTRAGEGRVRRAVLTILTGPLCKLSIVEFLEYTIMTWQFLKRIFISILSLLMTDCARKYTFNIKYLVLLQGRSLFALIIYIITQVHFERYWIRTPSPLPKSSYHLGTYRVSWCFNILLFFYVLEQNHLHTVTAFSVVTIYVNKMNYFLLKSIWKFLQIKSFIVTLSGKFWLNVYCFMLQYFP